MTRTVVIRGRLYSAQCHQMGVKHIHPQMVAKLVRLENEHGEQVWPKK